MLSDIENGKIKKNATLNAYHAPKQRNAVDKSRSKKRNRRKELKKPAETET